MLKIIKVEESEQSVISRKVSIFPNPSDFGDDCFSADGPANVANMLSTLAVNSIIEVNRVRIGDSSTVIELINTGNIGVAGMTEFGIAGVTFLKLAKEVLPEMSGKYQMFYGRYIADFEANGICMPGEGLIERPRIL